MTTINMRKLMPDRLFLYYFCVDSMTYVGYSIHILGEIYFFFLNGKFGSLTDYWSIIVPPVEPPDHIHLH
ncbi:hypothetical protein HanXRQr2_Chr17g0802291 [Helianthus annuus]|uniref:Uncharacterized protein n=1 Tax=Helianthus annuus TaxID=4232 RepID=A0A9K3DJQ4_HELAN|nr:hypothetical protein HanXRQr2_Chr17g0802291 [Helianthus annuus]KAJ0813121.1 hypothetical protein HanPSC8_Chr17g0769861 [Helianthus annuus]